MKGLSGSEGPVVNKGSDSKDGNLKEGSRVGSVGCESEFLREAVRETSSKGLTRPSTDTDYVKNRLRGRLIPSSCTLSEMSP